MQWIRDKIEALLCLLVLAGSFLACGGLVPLARFTSERIYVVVDRHEQQVDGYYSVL